MNSIDYWVQVMKDDYLPSSEYEGDDTISLVEERAVESLLSELRDALKRAESDWWQEPCTQCDGTGIYEDDTCLRCDGEGLEHRS